jgi:hypothetical protein
MAATQMTQANPPWHDAIVASIPLLREHCRDPWVVIGSAAAALAGVDVVVADVDVLTSAVDAQRLMDACSAFLDTSYRPDGSDRFRSRFARFRFSDGAPLEVMGDLEVYSTEGWQRVEVSSIVHVTVANVSVPIPVPSEQIRVLESFARPKDLLRAQLLRAL